TPSPTAYSDVSTRQSSTFATNYFGVVPARRLDRALLRRIIDVHQTKSLGVAERPLVVVEQRPGEVAAQIDALPHRAVRGAQVLPLRRQMVRMIPLYLPRVVVDSQEIDRLLDLPHVCIRPFWPRLAENLRHLFRVVAAQNWIQVLSVHVGVGAPHRVPVLRRL